MKKNICFIKFCFLILCLMISQTFQLNFLYNEEEGDHHGKFLAEYHGVYNFHNELDKEAKKDPHEGHDHTYKPIPIGGGLHDYLFNKSRDELIKIALVLDQYHREINHLPGIEGGIHDYINKLSDHEIREFISKEANEHPEVNNSDGIEKLLRGEIKKDNDTVDKEVGNYLLNLDRENLMKIAFNAEKYHKKVNHMEGSLGGLHDYIWNLSDDKIREYITKEVKEHSDLNKLETLKSMINDTNENITLLSTDVINHVDDKVNKKNLIMKDILKTMLRNKSKPELEAILKKLMININNPNFNFNVSDMSEENIRKIIKVLLNEFKNKINIEDYLKDMKH
jgi:hypothetical protein